MGSCIQPSIRAFCFVYFSARGKLVANSNLAHWMETLAIVATYSNREYQAGWGDFTPLKPCFNTN